MKKLNGERHANFIRRLSLIFCLLTAGAPAAPGDDEKAERARDFSKAEWEYLQSVQKPDAAELAAASKIAETFLRHCNAGRMKEALALADPGMFATTSRDEWTSGVKADVTRSGALKSCVLLAPRALRTPAGSFGPDLSGGSGPPSLSPVVKKPPTVLTLLFQCENANGASQAEVSISGTGKADAPLRVFDYQQVPLLAGEWAGFETALNLGFAVSLRATGAAEAEWRPLADAARRSAAIGQLPLPAVPGLTGNRAKDKAAALVYFRETLPREWKRPPPREGRPDPRLVILQMAAFHLAYEPGSSGNDDLLQRMRAVAGEDAFGSFPKICEAKLPASQGKTMTMAILNRGSSMLRFGAALQSSGFSGEGNPGPVIKAPRDGK